MGEKYVLIVDDDKSILRMLEFGLKKLGSDYKIFTAEDTYSAMHFIEEQYFDLIITDYMMPGMTGIDLVRAVRSLSPDTHVVLMTAYGTSKLEDTTDNLHVDAYLSKPFTMDQIREIVRQMAAHISPAQEMLSDSNHTFSEISPTLPSVVSKDKSVDQMTVIDHLQKLQINAGSRAVLLVDKDGKAVQIVGEINQTKTHQICDLVAANHYGPAKLSKLLDNNNTFKASFYEGDAYNLYVCNVNDKCLLAVVFDIKLRPGVVWFYTKQTANALSLLFD